MRSTRPLWLVFIATLGLPACTGGFGTGTGDRFGQPGEDDIGEVPTPVCPADPDCAIGGDCSLYECPDYWICEDQPNGRKRCINPGPDYPDGGDWDCEDRDGTTICSRHGDYPDGGGGDAWNCELQGDLVVCTDNTPSYPDGGAGGPYNCWFQDEFRICETIPGGSGDGGGWSCYDPGDGSTECRNNNPGYPDDGEWACWDQNGTTFCRRHGDDVPDGGGGGEWNCELQGEFVVCSDDTPDYPDGGGGGDWDCHFGDEFRICTPDIPDVPDTGRGECVPGVQRWCDDATYCSWGKQTCLPDGTWGRCVEPRVTSDGLVDRPDTACGCRFFYFNEDCCEDQGDADRDGHPDCIIPTSHTAPACASTGGLCSYCDSHTDCGGANDLCIFRSDGYAMCGRECSSASDCGAGYECRTIGTRSGYTQQCVPSGGSCE
ncbi:MAG: hypothetical protein R3B82_08490 [Sandaracinaceae bacterium]